MQPKLIVAGTMVFLCLFNSAFHTDRTQSKTITRVVYDGQSEVGLLSFDLLYVDHGDPLTFVEIPKDRLFLTITNPDYCQEGEFLTTPQLINQDEYDNERKWAQARHTLENSHTDQAIALVGDFNPIESGPLEDQWRSGSHFAVLFELQSSYSWEDAFRLADSAAVLRVSPLVYTQRTNHGWEPLIAEDWVALP